MTTIIKKVLATFYAHIRSIGTDSLTLKITNMGKVTVNADSSITITKAGQTAQISNLAVGDYITASGILDTQSNTLTASSISD